MLEGDDRPGAQGDAAFFAILLAENGEGQPAVEIVRPQLDAAEDGLAHGVRLSFSLKDNSLRRAWLDELMPRVLETASAELAGQIAASWQDWAIAAGGSPAQVRAATEAAESLMASPWGVRIPVVRLAALGRDGLGDAEAAERHYRTALELDDSLYNMHNNLAMLLIGRGQGSEAVSHAQRAVDLARTAGAPPAELGNLLDTLAKAHEAAGQPAEAAATRSEAAALSDR